MPSYGGKNRSTSKIFNLKYTNYFNNVCSKCENGVKLSLTSDKHQVYKFTSLFNKSQVYNICKQQENNMEHTKHVQHQTSSQKNFNVVEIIITTRGYFIAKTMCVCVCVCSNSRNDVPRVAQRYGTIAALTRRRASVLVVFIVFCAHIRRAPPPTFSDTAITVRHSDTTIFQPRAHWVQISWSIGSEKSFGHVPPVGVEPSTSCMQGEHPIH